MASQGMWQGKAQNASQCSLCCSHKHQAFYPGEHSAFFSSAVQVAERSDFHTHIVERMKPFWKKKNKNKKTKYQFPSLSAKIYVPMQIFFKKGECFCKLHHSNHTVVETSTCFSWPTFSGWQEIKAHVKLQQILNRLACALQSQLLNLFGPHEFVSVRQYLC